MTLEQLIAELSKLKQELEKTDYIHEKQKFFKLMIKVRRFIASIDDKDKDLSDLFFHSNFYLKYAEFFRYMNIYFERALEASEALAIIANSQNYISGLIDLMDAEFIKEDYLKKGNDLKSVDFSGNKTLAMIGCGPMPETMLYIYENTSIKKVIGIDYNYEAIYIAGEMIRSLNLTDIKLEYCDGRSYNYNKVDIAYIPSFVEAKGEILEQIVNNGKDNIQIIIRNPLSFSSMIYPPLPAEIHPALKIKTRQISAGPFDNAEIIILEKYNI